jgi:hypothetical protein
LQLLAGSAWLEKESGRMLSHATALKLRG